MIGTLRVYTSRLATKESYWVFHRDGDDFDLKVSDPKNPSYLLIANDPEMESIIGALNALILNRLVTRVNTGQGKNIPVSIIVDELPTLYFHKIDRLIGTARSNKVSVTLGFQELPQLEADYGKVGMQKIITTVGNVVSGSARAKETLEWLSNDIFGKVVQVKKGVTIDRDKTSINLNENMDALVPASKISDMATGWICGQTARDFTKTKTGTGGSMNIQESEEFKTTKFFCKTDFDMKEIKKEEAGYVPLPKFYTFKSRDERERILYKNFVQVGLDVKEMIKDVLNEIAVEAEIDKRVNKNVKHLQYSRYYCRCFYYISPYPKTGFRTKKVLVNVTVVSQMDIATWTYPCAHENTVHMKMRAVFICSPVYLGSFATYQYGKLLITEIVVFLFIRTAFDSTVNNIAQLVEADFLIDTLRVCTFQ